jgi:hypothetical protein
MKSVPLYHRSRPADNEFPFSSADYKSEVPALVAVATNTGHWKKNIIISKSGAAVDLRPLKNAERRTPDAEV